MIFFYFSKYISSKSGEQLNFENSFLFLSKLLFESDVMMQNDNSQIGGDETVN